MTGVCSPADREELASCMNMFFTRRPLLQSTPPRQDRDKARVLKTADEICGAWERIFHVRRFYEADDQKPISDPCLLATMWTDWAKDWMAGELTPEQQKLAHNKKTSIFNAWIFSHMGGKNFVMAMWQTGMTWAPTPQLLNADFNGALEHVARNFASWTRRLARAVHRHKHDEATLEARVRSGTTYGKHGLSQAQEQDRKDRAEARRNYYMTQELDKRYQASKGKGQGKGKGKTKRGASEHTFPPKTWDEMSRDERWWLQQLWNGNLLREKQHAESKCHRVEAAPFRIRDTD